MTGSVERSMRKAKTHERRGEIAQALTCYRSVLDGFPANLRAQKAVLRLTQEAWEPPKSALQEIHRCYGDGRLQEALSKAAALIEAHPKSEPLWTLLGAAATGLGQLEVARRAFEQASLIKPKSAPAHANLATVLERQGNFAAAAAQFGKALDLAPGDPVYLLSRGNAYSSAGISEAALRDFEAAIRATPENVDAHRLFGQALLRSGQVQPAKAAFDRAIELDPADMQLRVNIGEMFVDAGQTAMAINWLEAAVDIDPGHAPAHLSLGTANLACNQLDQAIRHLEQALAVDPACVKSLNNLASAQFSKGQLDAARISCERAISLNPDHAKAYHNLANVHQQRGQLDLAVESYASAINLDPSLHAAQAQMLHFQAQMCDWSAYQAFAHVSDRLGITGEAVSPWALLGFEDNPGRQRRRSEHYAQQWPNHRPRMARPHNKPRLRVGYFSGDLYDHATLFLLNGVLECHDRTAFEVIVYGLNAPRTSPQFDRMLRAVDQFVDMHDASDADIAARAQGDALDIAVDLKGYTQGARPGLFFSGLAPVQINFLGYPGTLGADAFDYIVADQFVIPPEQRQHYTENVVFMPHSYQPNDNRRNIAATVPTRSECALPDDAIVMCCFNNSYKITPREFDIWMRVMARVDNAVLWLLNSNEWACTNLRAEAEARGIAPDRLVFADKLPQDRHLARHRLADFFVDTFRVNAHTTASDALFAGLPVVTRTGTQFAARVGTSLCQAVGMPDLIASDDAAYEDLILKLARDPAALAEARARLSSGLRSAPLFDTQSYARDLETGYRLAWDAWRCGHDATDIHIAADAQSVRKTG